MGLELPSPVTIFVTLWVIISYLLNNWEVTKSTEGQISSHYYPVSRLCTDPTKGRDGPFLHKCCHLVDRLRSAARHHLGVVMPYSIRPDPRVPGKQEESEEVGPEDGVPLASSEQSWWVLSRQKAEKSHGKWEEWGVSVARVQGDQAEDGLWHVSDQ